MTSERPTIFAAPGTYVQGAGALGQAGQHLARLGRSVLGIVDPAVRDAVEPTLASACAAAPVAWHGELFGGECGDREIERLTGVAKSSAADVVVAAGGGKALDTGKLVAAAIGARSVMAPTIAASDASTSRIAVVYDDHHVLQRVARLTASPDLVLVDTAIIVQAPARYLVAGMGDALSTWPEARSCAAGSATTILGGRPSTAALALAELCYRNVLAHGREALADLEARRLTPAFETVVEANILLSGLGFESGGLAVAHAVHGGLTAVPETAVFLHGEKVAFGIVVQAVVEAWADDARHELEAFYADVGLPRRLADVGLAKASKADIRRIAEVSCKPGSHIHNLRAPVSVERLAAILESLRN
jgi:glycerol dehydrogenase